MGIGSYLQSDCRSTEIRCSIQSLSTASTAHDSGNTLQLHKIFAEVNHVNPWLASLCM